MPRIEDINRAIDKLNSKEENGETIPGYIEHIDKGRKEERINYILKNRLVFSFGLTRSSRRREKEFHYVPRQMKLTNKDFTRLVSCPMTKKEYNSLHA